MSRVDVLQVKKSVDLSLPTNFQRLLLLLVLLLLCREALQLVVAHQGQLERSVLVQVQLHVLVQIVDGQLGAQIVKRDPRLRLLFLHHARRRRCCGPVATTTTTAHHVCKW